MRTTHWFDAEVVHVEDMAIIRATGELDVATEPQLRNAVRDAFDRPIFCLSLDLRELTFCDTTILRVLDVARGIARQKSVEVRLLPGDAASNILRIFTP